MPARQRAGRVEAPFVENDDLTITMDRGCRATGFSVIDSATSWPDEVVRFLDSDDVLIHESRFPWTFVGIVSIERPIRRIHILEAAADEDDVTYDDRICVR